MVQENPSGSAVLPAHGAPGFSLRGAGAEAGQIRGPLPERTIGTHLYIGYPTYLSIPKPERYRTFFILRDPRDISVSWYFAARYSHGALDPIPRLRKDLKNLGLEDGLKYSIDSLEEFGLFWAQRSWMSVEQDRDRIRIFRYEDFSKDNRKFLEDLLDYIGVALPEDEFAALYERHAFKQVTGGRAAGVEDQHDHYRKGVSGDWRNYFDDSLRRYFREVTGDLLDCWATPTEPRALRPPRGGASSGRNLTAGTRSLRASGRIRISRLIILNGGKSSGLPSGRRARSGPVEDPGPHLRGPVGRVWTSSKRGLPPCPGDL